MNYIAPLRCKHCGIPIEKKLKAKTPKYCSPCRQANQQLWREKSKNNRQRVTR